MIIGSKLTKFKLNQFYTPLTISEFICGLMDPSVVGPAIDPAGGTGDLLLYFSGQKTIWDIDESALKLCKFNYELNKLSNYELVCKNSLADFQEDIEKYAYVATNPPFGSSTVVTDSSILKNFELGIGKKKQEIGILFIELGIRLLKEGGIMFIILPTGYLGNINSAFVELRKYLLKHKILAVLELPKSTFKRSETGVNTCLLVVQKMKPKTNDVVESCEIFISGIENIGYNLSKKDTPKKYKMIAETGENIVSVDTGLPILDNDFVLTVEQFKQFCRRNNIININDIGVCNQDSSSPVYEFIMSNKLDGTNILDIKRYQTKYLNVIERLSISNGGTCINVNSFATNIKKCFKIEKSKKYKYIDIGEINTPLHGYKELYGWELPTRAKYVVKKNDILISKLEGTMSYCIILTDDDNFVVTNGVAIFRPNDLNSLYILFANITNKDFTIQHNAHVTGSIMASLTESDIGRFLVDSLVDINISKKIINTLEILQKIQI